MKLIQFIKSPYDFFKLSKTKKIQKIGAFLFNLFSYIILFSVGYVVVYPLIYMIVTALRSPESYFDPTHNWVPTSINLDNFKRAFDYMDFKNSLYNTVRYEIISAILEVVSCAVAGYGFARFNFKFKNFLLLVLFLTILIPSPMIIIPLVTNFSHMDVLGILGLIKNLIGVDLRIRLLGTSLTFWLPSLLGTGLRSGILIYIYIQFFKGLPKELEEASWIDGAGPIKTFILIAIPSSSVVIITVAVFSLVWHWNDYFVAAMYSVGNKTLALAATELPSAIKAHSIYDVGIEKGCILAGTVLFVVPLLIVYLFMQRGFIESIDRVGITG